METLRGFVDAVWRYHTDIHHEFATKNAGTLVWSKPDTISDSFELRRLTTPKNYSDIRTDFFEFYWQHLMEGTTYGHVIGWASTLLLRKPGSVPKQLSGPYVLLWLLAIAVTLLALYAAVAAATDEPPISPWLSAILSVALLPLGGALIKGTIGDAARYLHPAPTNVQCRHAIREAGIKVLVALHDRKEYDRIIVVGHSLGSVIGYDILTHAWPKYNQAVPRGAHAPITCLDALEALASSGSGSDADIHKVQRAYFDELVGNSCAWRVTDFLTLGSPLAHAEVLLARDRADLDAKQRDRELPTSLPTLEHTTEHQVAVARFSFPGQPKGFRVPHHAAVFGPTRWTNVYFPNRRIVYGDLIGGPLSGIFGQGIRDMKVTTTQRRGMLSHTLYWKYELGTEAPPHIHTLRVALDLLDNGGVLPPPPKPARVEPADIPAEEAKEHHEVPPAAGAGV